MVRSLCLIWSSRGHHAQLSSLVELLPTAEEEERQLESWRAGELGFHAPEQACRWMPAGPRSCPHSRAELRAALGAAPPQSPTFLC